MKQKIKLDVSRFDDLQKERKDLKDKIIKLKAFLNNFEPEKEHSSYIMSNQDYFDAMHKQLDAMQLYSQALSSRMFALSERTHQKVR